MKNTQTQTETQTETQTLTPATPSPSAPSGTDPKSCTIGLDLGDARHAYCILDAQAKVLARGRVSNDRVSLGRFLHPWAGATLVMEAGTHSPWIARLVEAAGHPLILAHPRKTRSIWQNKQKDDDRDAEQLARLENEGVRLCMLTFSPPALSASPIHRRGQESLEKLRTSSA